MPSPPSPSMKTPAGARPGGRIQWILLVVMASAVGGAAIWWMGPWRPGSAALQATAPSMAGDADAAAFSAQHWVTPIPPQGPAPASIVEPARGIAPEDCGACHYQQYEDWQGSWHARAMGPGVVGQFPGFDAEGRAQCLRCHAPLTEQWADLPPDAQAAASAPWQANPDFNAALARKGVTCAACHLRRHVRHAPPLDPVRAAAQPDGVLPAGTLLHGAPVRTPFFTASEFCMGCHQHGPDTLHVNGKAIENTYREWLASPAAAQGRSCQDCHMPGRRHLWRGIHDPETTRAGVTVHTVVEPEAPEVGAKVRARLELTNSGVGHAFPTYTTPAVYLRAALLDAEGRVLPGHHAEHTVQRRLDMGTQPWGEFFDTRLEPGATAKVTLAATVPDNAATLYLWVWVEPDQFYAGFFRDWLAGGAPPEGAAELEAALVRAERSGYLLYGRRVPIGR